MNGVDLFEEWWGNVERAVPVPIAILSKFCKIVLSAEKNDPVLIFGSSTAVRYK
jgi:hypothetical protein